MRLGLFADCWLFGNALIWVSVDFLFDFCTSSAWIYKHSWISCQGNPTNITIPISLIMINEPGLSSRSLNSISISGPHVNIDSAYDISPTTNHTICSACSTHSLRISPVEEAWITTTARRNHMIWNMSTSPLEWIDSHICHRGNYRVQPSAELRGSAGKQKSKHKKDDHQNNLYRTPDIDIELIGTILKYFTYLISMPTAKISEYFYSPFPLHKTIFDLE